MGRKVDKTEGVAADIASARPGARVLGIGGVDVRNAENLFNAAERCVRELGGIDFLMYDLFYSPLLISTSSLESLSPYVDLEDHVLTRL